MQVVSKASGNNHLSGFKLVTQFSRNGQAVFVVEFAFKEIHIVIFTVRFATHCNPLDSV
jgi:hypothetical protein